MSVVIPFAPRQRSATVEPSVDVAATPATILFFTGIRYERHEEPAPVERPEQPKRRAARPLRRAQRVGKPA
jgi:hypothetical protein